MSLSNAVPGFVDAPSADGGEDTGGTDALSDTRPAETKEVPETPPEKSKTTEKTETTIEEAKAQAGGPPTTEESQTTTEGPETSARTLTGLDVDIDNGTCEQVRVTVNSAPSRSVVDGEVRITVRLDEPQVLGQEQVVGVGETAVFDDPRPEYPVPGEETTTEDPKAVPGKYGVYVGGELVDFVIVEACEPSEERASTTEEQRPPKEEDRRIDSDGDRVVDAEDRCPDECGPAENDGCPADTVGDAESSDGENATEARSGPADRESRPPRVQDVRLTTAEENATVSPSIVSES